MLAYGYPESVYFKQPAIPTQVGQVVTLFDSAVMLGPSQLRFMNGTLLQVSFEILSNDSAANGLIAYQSNDGGTTYTQTLMRDSNGTATMPVTVTAANAPQTLSFVVAPFKDFKLTFTTGVIPTTWALTIVLHTNSSAVQQ